MLQKPIFRKIDKEDLILIVSGAYLIHATQAKTGRFFVTIISFAPGAI